MSASPTSIRRRWRELSFGFSATTLSGFGQTYFISMFLVSLVGAHGISSGRFGILYSAATLCAGLLLPVLGRWLDRVGERRAFLFAAGGLALSITALAWAPVWWLLFPALLGMRAFGQGALPLISMTAMARYFERRRGIALGISSLGFPAGEMILPTVSLVLIAVLGWRESLFFYVGVVLAAAIAVRLLFLRSDLNPEPSAAGNVGKSEATAPRFAWWRDPFFLAATGSSLVSPFGGTIAFLYLIPIVESKGWPPDWVGAGFVGFAAIRAVVSIGVGPVIDSLGGLRVFPLSIAPFSAAVACLLFADSPWVGMGFFLFLGLSFGSGSAQTAMLAEVYGARRIGEIRGLATAATILATSMGPLFAGVAIDLGWSFDAILASLLVIAIISLGCAFCVPLLAENARNSRES